MNDPDQDRAIDYVDRDWPLSAAHRRMILDSAIGAEISQARGYRTVTAKGELARLGFGPG
jgi:hypothetical protein